MKLDNFLKAISKIVHGLYKGTHYLLKSIRYILSKVFALVVLFDLYVIYFASTIPGRIALPLSFVLAFCYSDPNGTVEFWCCLYFTYTFGTMITFYFLFKSKRFEEWCFHELGEEKVRRLVYRSPAVAKILSTASTGVGVVVTALIGFDATEKHIHASTTEQAIRTGADAAQVHMHKGIKEVGQELDRNIEIAQSAGKHDAKKRISEAYNQHTKFVNLYEQQYTEEVKSLRSLREKSFHSSLETSADKLRSIIVAEEVGKTVRKAGSGWSIFGGGK
jgi:hypothetical protein